MAKLQGVSTIDMQDGEITKIAHYGVEYTKVDGDAQAGDLVRVISASIFDANAGDFFEAFATDIYRDVRFRDNAGDKRDPNYDGLTHNYAYFRKLAQPAKVSVERVSTPFAEMITSKVDAVEKRVTALETAEQQPPELAYDTRVKALRSGEFGNIGAGEIGRVSKVSKLSNDPYNVRVRAGLQIDYFRPQDLELASKVTPVESLKVGDYATINTRSYSVGITKGKAYLVEEDRYSNLFFRDDDGDKRWIALNGATKVSAPTPPKPTVGDIVVITGNSNGSRNKVGDIGKVVEAENNDNHTVSVEVPSRPHTMYASGNYTKFNEMRHATVAEKVEYEKAVEVASFIIGDYVKVVTRNLEHKVGDVVKITGTRVNGDAKVHDFKVSRESHGATGYIDAKHIEKLGASDAVFTKAGRKPNEYRKGDIVRVVDTLCTAFLDVGQITEVESQFGEGNPDVRSNDGGTRYAEVEIVCFAEDRKDMAKGGR